MQSIFSRYRLQLFVQLVSIDVALIRTWTWCLKFDEYVVGSGLGSGIFLGVLRFPSLATKTSTPHSNSISLHVHLNSITDILTGGLVLSEMDTSAQGIVDTSMMHPATPEPRR